MEVIDGQIYPDLEEFGDAAAPTRNEHQRAIERNQSRRVRLRQQLTQRRYRDLEHTPECAADPCCLALKGYASFYKALDLFNSYGATATFDQYGVFTNRAVLDDASSALMHAFESLPQEATEEYQDCCQRLRQLALEFKSAGSKSFKQKRPQRAKECYETALQLLELFNDRESQTLQLTISSNLIITLRQMDSLEAALELAEQALTPQNQELFEHIPNILQKITFNLICTRLDLYEKNSCNIKHLEDANVTFERERGLFSPQIQASLLNRFQSFEYNTLDPNTLLKAPVA